MRENDFPFRFVKGRIAETVFELMFRESSGFDVFPLGYEHTTPLLIHYRNHHDTVNKDIIKEILANFEHTPDFMLVSNDKSKLYLVEVKYREKFNISDLLSIAKQIGDKWHPVKLFLATPEGFYYSSCKDILKNSGRITPLPETLIPKEKQEYYLDLLKRFEK